MITNSDVYHDSLESFSEGKKTLKKLIPGIVSKLDDIAM